MGNSVENKTAFEVIESSSDIDSNDAVTLLQEAADSYKVIDFKQSSSTPIYIHQNYETNDKKILSASSLNLHITKNTEVTIVEVVGGTELGLQWYYQDYLGG